MEFLGVGPLEFFFVVLIALIVIGPRDLSKSARTAGRFLNRLYKSETWRAVTQASRSLRGLPNRLAREAEMEELRSVRRDLESAAHDVAQEGRQVQSAAREAAQNASREDAGLKAWTTPPAPPPSPSGPADKPESPSE